MGELSQRERILDEVFMEGLAKRLDAVIEHRRANGTLFCDVCQGVIDDNVAPIDLEDGSLGLVCYSCCEVERGMTKGLTDESTNFGRRDN